MRTMSARHALGPQPAIPNMAGQRRIRPGETQWSQLIQQCRRPEVRVPDKPLCHLGDEHVERVRRDSNLCSQAALPSQIGLDGDAVVVGAAGDLTDRNPLSFERVEIHVITLVIEKEGPSRAGSWSTAISIERGPFV